jgi:hypothetical protein
MNNIDYIPYKTIENRSFSNETKLIITKEKFNNINFQEGKVTLSFEFCFFESLEIKNLDVFKFKTILISFHYCVIGEINIKEILENNISVHFSNSIISGDITSNKLNSVTLLNCFIPTSIYFRKLKKLYITYDERASNCPNWNELFIKCAKSFKDLLETKNNIYIEDCENATIKYTKQNIDSLGLYYKENPPGYQNDDFYILNEKEKEKLNISLKIEYSKEAKNKSILIENMILNNLSVIGPSQGKLSVQNTKINRIFIENYSTELGATFYNIRSNPEKGLLEIKHSTLKNVDFSNFLFDTFSRISIYRNNLKDLKLSACNFPNVTDMLSIFFTVENIHYPEKTDNNYNKLKYDTLIQLKNIIESSGNIYESQKFHELANESLRKIEDLNKWDKLILCSNNVTNSHGLSIKKPLCIALIFSILLYIVYLFSLGKIFNFNDNFDLDLIGYYFPFIDFTHKLDFLVSKEELNGFSLFFDYLNRIVIAYLGYQFISAFRKFGKQKSNQ